MNAKTFADVKHVNLWNQRKRTHRQRGTWHGKGDKTIERCTSLSVQHGASFFTLKMHDEILGWDRWPQGTEAGSRVWAPSHCLRRDVYTGCAEAGGSRTAAWPAPMWHSSLCRKSRSLALSSQRKFAGITVQSLSVRFHFQNGKREMGERSKHTL